MTRVLVIGLDGATLDLVEPWVRQGNLPVLGKLISDGGYSHLKSVMPVISPAAWASFMTGMNPGKHGFYDFIRREPSSYRLRPLHGGQMGGTTLWKLLGNKNLRVGVINVPMTYPPEEVNGILISGLGTPNNKNFAFPKDLEKKLLSSGFHIRKQHQFTPGQEEIYLEEIKNRTNEITNISIELLDTQVFDFFMVVFRETDEIAHFFWRYMDSRHPAHNPNKDTIYKNEILHYYQKIDTIIGQLVDAAGEDVTVIIMSDHGSGPLYKDVYLNEWLINNGYLFLKSDLGLNEIFRSRLRHLGITRTNVAKALHFLKLGELEYWIKVFGRSY